MPPNKKDVMESKDFTSGPDNEGKEDDSGDLTPNFAANDIPNIRRNCSVNGPINDLGVGGGNILDTACNDLSAATKYLEACKKTVMKSRDSLEETPPSLASQARLHNIQRLQGALNELLIVIRRLSASLVNIGENGAKPERVFTPVLLNMIVKEASEIKQLSVGLSAGAEDVVGLEREMNLILDAVRRCADAFEPTRLAIFRPDRRHNDEGNKETSKVGNRTREYLRSLDVDWEGLGRVREALPVASQMPSLVDGAYVGNENLSEEDAAELFRTGTIRYWPV